MLGKPPCRGFSCNHCRNRNPQPCGLSKFIVNLELDTVDMFAGCPIVYSEFLNANPYCISSKSISVDENLYFHFYIAVARDRTEIAVIFMFFFFYILILQSNTPKKCFWFRVCGILKAKFFIFHFVNGMALNFLVTFRWFGVFPPLNDFFFVCFETDDWKQMMSFCCCCCCLCYQHFEYDVWPLKVNFMIWSSLC